MLTTTRIRSIALALVAGASLTACQPSTPAGSAAPALGRSAQALSEQSENGKKGQQGKDGSTCVVTPGDGNTLVTGIVLAPDAVLYNGHVLYDAQGVIQCVGKACDTLPEAASATRIDCHKGVISPGLINGHDHLTYQEKPYAFTAERYEHRHDWRTGSSGHTPIVTPSTPGTAAYQWAELRQLMSGTTSLNGSGHGEGLMRNLDRDGQNGVFPATQQVLYETFPLGDSGGQEYTDACRYSLTRTAAEIANAAAFSPHMSEGIETSARNEFRCISGQARDSFDLLGPKVALIHAIGLNAYDAAALKVSGASVVWSPRTNIALYGDTAQVPLYRTLGVNVALGTDWLRSGSMNMLRELACADELNATYFNNALSSVDLWKMATANAADALGASGSVGRLAPGLQADFAIYAVNGLEDTPHRAVITAQPQDVVLTVRGGKVLYGDAAVVSALSAGCNTLDVCGTSKAVCLDGESTPGWDALVAANASAYPLFVCGTPDDEPTCIPQRTAVNASFPSASVNGSTVYSGNVVELDVDGDAIADTQDNCPAVFNPVRPMDNGQQADFDHDGVGDACDACPLSAGVESCASLDDLDQDGVANTDDNCRFLANGDQVDQDADGKGDACDACPTDSNPGLQICPPPLYSVYDLKTGKVPSGSTVRIANVIVTGKVKNNGVFVQVHPSDAGYQGPEFSGIYLYTVKDPAALQIGDRLNVTGVLGSYQGQMQLTANATWTILGRGNAAPAPVLVTPGDINEKGARRAALESVVVQVQNVRVSAQELRYNEFFVADTAGVTVRVDDSVYGYTMPAVGTVYSSVSGVLAWRNYQSKIEVRGMDDLVTAP